MGTIGERWFLRIVGETDEVDADGDNWDRDEWRAYAMAEFSPAPNWTLGVGYRYQEADFDNLHDVFLQQRRDENSEAFASLNYRFKRRWEIRGQVTFVDQKSTLEVYDFERTVLSLGISYDF